MIYLQIKFVFIRADLHDTAFSHTTSFRQASDMTWDHSHAHNIFTYKIIFAKVCTGIFGARVLTNSKQISFSCPAL